MRSSTVRGVSGLSPRLSCCAAAMAAAMACASLPNAPGLRVATYNMTSYAGQNETDAFDTAVRSVFYGVFSGRSMQPDVVMLQEMPDLTGVSYLAGLLNDSHQAAYGSRPWAAAPFFNQGSGPYTAVVYRTDRLTLVTSRLVRSGSSSANPRPVTRFDFRPAGFVGADAVLSLYPVHAKAGTTQSDIDRRLSEAQTTMADVRTGASEHAIVGGDFNVYTSTETGYQAMTVTPAAEDRLYDPVKSPGSWNNNSSFTFLHSQDPSGAGGMDDRFDQLLVTQALIDGDGFDYIGDPSRAFSTTNWNDPNHSYRTWGNDGASYNGSLNTNNFMVGSTIASALRLIAKTGGHLPVYMDLRVPQPFTTPSVIDLGEIALGDQQVVQFTVSVPDVRDVWGPSGVDGFSYTIQAPPGVLVIPSGSSLVPAGSTFTHTVRFTPDAPEDLDFELVVSSDGEDRSRPIRVLATAEVCVPDFVVDGVLDVFDVLEFFAAFAAITQRADLVDDNRLDVFDILEYFNLFGAGC